MKYLNQIIKSSNSIQLELQFSLAHHQSDFGLVVLGADFYYPATSWKCSRHILKSVMHSRAYWPLFGYLANRLHSLQSLTFCQFIHLLCNIWSYGNKDVLERGTLQQVSWVVLSGAFNCIDTVLTLRHEKKTQKRATMFT